MEFTLCFQVTLGINATIMNLGSQKTAVMAVAAECAGTNTLVTMMMKPKAIGGSGDPTGTEVGRGAVRRGFCYSMC